MAPSGSARLLWAWVLAASGTFAQALPLDDYVRGVVDTSPLVQEQIHAYRQVAQDERIALSGWRPRLDLFASASQATRKAPNTLQQRRDYSSQQADFTLTQNLFDGFNTTNQVAQARARLTAAAYQLYDTADNVALTAVQAYLDALAQNRLVQLAAQNVESHMRILEQIRVLGTRGLARRSDLQQTEGRLAGAQASLVAQQNNLEDALTQVHTLLGRYVSAAELVDPESPAPLHDMALDPLVDEAMRTHPAIESARNSIEAARFDYARSQSSDLPSVDLSLSQTVGNDIDGPFGHTEEASVALNLRYNFYRGGADLAEQRKRASVVQERKSFLDRVRRQVIDKLRLALSADRALRGQAPYLDEHSERALETVELYREEYLLQQRTLVDLLNAEGELNNALTSQAEALYDSLAARFRVYEGVGALFDALALSVDVRDGDVHIAKLRAAGIDDVTLPVDRDDDGVPDDADQCDNSPAGAHVDASGCVSRPPTALGFEAVDVTFEAVADTYSTPVGQSLVILVSDLIANDRVSVRDQPELRAYTQPPHGAVTLNADGNLTYTPVAAFAGEDGFEYTIGDRRGRRASGRVQVWVGTHGAAPPDDVVRLHFAYKQLVFTPESDADFDAVVDVLVARPDLQVEIRAYTDSTGTESYNQRLSAYRADAVRMMLEARGVAAGRILAEGRGESEPVADNSTELGRALNRRVEVRFRKPGGS